MNCFKHFLIEAFSVSMIYDKLYNLFSQDIEDGQQRYFIVVLFLSRTLYGWKILKKSVNKLYVSVKIHFFVESYDFIH